MNSLALAGIIVGGIAFITAIKQITRCIELKREWHAERARLRAMQLQAPASSVAQPASANIELESVNRFLDGILREKPARFTPENLREFTRGYAERVGSGGFGVVYRGRFPNGVAVAVKVLNGTLDRRAEEQFMAEVGTAGRTYVPHQPRPPLRLLLRRLRQGARLRVPPQRLPRPRPLPRPQPQDDADAGRPGVRDAAGDRGGHGEGDPVPARGVPARIIHYDIKPGNVLLAADYSPRVADFGLARLCNRDKTHLTMTGV